MAKTHTQAITIAALIALPQTASLSFHPPSTSRGGINSKSFMPKTWRDPSSKLSLHLPAQWSHLLRPMARHRPAPFHAILDKSEDTTDTFFMDEGNEKEWAVKKPPPISPDSFQRARLAEQLRLSKEVSSKSAPPSPQVEETPFSLLASQLTADIIEPILNPQIEKEVPAKYILGAAINGSFVTFLAATLLFGLSIPIFETIVAAFSVGILAAYVSITRGKSGEVLRDIGKYTMDLTDSAWEMYKEFEAGLKVEKASKALETLSRVNAIQNASVKTVLEQADKAVQEVKRAEAELEAAAEKRKRALVEASEMIDNVERAKMEAIKMAHEEKRRADQEEMENKRLEEERLWLEEQNRLANERLQARLEEEKRIAETRRLMKNPVDYYAAAKLAYESSDKSDGFYTFRSNYLKTTSAMVAEKHKERQAALRLEAERLEAEKLEAENAKRVEAERLEAEEKMRLEAEQAAQRAAEELKRMEAVKAEEEALAAKREAERIAQEKERLILEEQAKAAAAELEEKERLEAAEAKRLADEEAARIEEEEKRAEEAARREAERIIREEEARLMEEQAAAAKEAILLAEEQDMMDDDEDIIDDEDWEASVRLANQLAGIEAFEDEDGDINMNEMDDFLKVELDDLTQDEEELLGKAAREAVRKYEEEMRMKRSQKQAVRSSWDEELVVKSNIQEEDGEDDVELDYSQMTVSELKDILRSRGLKVSGKKGELIERLMSS